MRTPRKPPAPPPKLEDRFVDNVSRYPFYLATVLLGGLWALALQPVRDLYQKSPLLAYLALLGSLIGLILIHFTLRGMSGDTFFPEWLLARLPDWMQG